MTVSFYGNIFLTDESPRFAVPSVSTFELYQLPEDHFLKVYNPHGVIWRKAAAIPMALWNLILAVYHLVSAVFEKKGHGQWRLAHAKKDLQASLGYLITLFNDKKGSYLVVKVAAERLCLNFIEEKIVFVVTDFLCCFKPRDEFIKNFSASREIRMMQLLKTYNFRATFKGRTLMYKHNGLRMQPIPIVEEPTDA